MKTLDKTKLIPKKVYVKGTAKKKGYWTTVWINPEEEDVIIKDKKGKEWKTVEGEKIRVYKEGQEITSQKYIENKAKEGLEEAASKNDLQAMTYILDVERRRFGTNSSTYNRLQKIYDKLNRIIEAGYVYRQGNEFIEVNGSIIDLNQAEKQSEVMSEEKTVFDEGYSDTELQEKYQPYKPILVSRAMQHKYPDNDYLSPEMKKGLRNYQADGVNSALENYAKGKKGFICADGTGAGKTRQQLALAYEQMKKGKTVLICTEKISLAKKNFVDGDGNEMGLKDKIVVLENPKKYFELESKGRLEKGKIYVTAYNKLKQFYDENNKPLAIDQIIFDESHNMKNVQGSQKAKYGIGLMEQATNIALYTASPMDKVEHIGYIETALGLNRDELRGKLKNPNSVKQASNFGRFFDMLTTEGMMIKREVPLNNVEFTAKHIQLSKAEQADFNKQYNAFLDTLLDLKMTPGIRGIDIMSATAQGLLRLRGYVEQKLKVKESVKILEEEIKAGRQVVLFASRVNAGKASEDTKITEGTLKEIERILKQKGYDVGSLFGGKTKQKQMEDLDAFQRTTKEAQKTGKRKIDILLATEQSGSTGYNMDDNKGDKPRTLIDLTPSFSANISIQKYGRVNRMSTKSKSRIIQMVTNTPIDNWLFNKSASKMMLLGAVVQGEAQTLFSKTSKQQNEFNLESDLLQRMLTTQGYDPVEAKKLEAKLIGKIAKNRQMGKSKMPILLSRNEILIRKN